MHEKTLAPDKYSMASCLRGRGKESFLRDGIQRRKSIQKRRSPSFFRTSTTALLHGLSLGLIAPALSIFWMWSLTSSDGADDRTVSFLEGLFFREMDSVLRKVTTSYLSGLKCKDVLIFFKQFESLLAFLCISLVQSCKSSSSNNFCTRSGRESVRGLVPS